MSLGGRKSPGVDQASGELGQDQGGGGGRDEGQDCYRNPPPIRPQERQNTPQGSQGPAFGPSARPPGGFLCEFLSGQQTRLFIKSRLYIGPVGRSQRNYCHVVAY